MSRCFPFPPPGYVRNGACGEALIESIKLQREKEKAKKDRRKEKRRDKKEKKKERKEKGLASNVKESKLIDLKKIRADEGSGCVQKGDDYENEQFEKSDITEEHCQPVSSRELCCLSDSTQSSKKRKRSTSPSSQEHGTLLKIRLPLRKHREPGESKLEDQLGSTRRSLGTADSSAQDTNARDHQLQRVTDAGRYQCLRNSDSRHSEELRSLVHGAARITNSFDDESRSVLSVYNSLFLNWVPPPLTCERFGLEDQDWLFSSKLQEERLVSKKVESVTDALRCSSPSLWPRAQYLPEVELYALPYSVPF